MEGLPEYQGPEPDVLADLDRRNAAHDRPECRARRCRRCDRGQRPRRSMPPAPDLPHRRWPGQVGDPPEPAPPPALPPDGCRAAGRLVRRPSGQPRTQRYWERRPMDRHTRTPIGLVAAVAPTVALAVRAALVAARMQRRLRPAHPPLSVHHHARVATATTTTPRAPRPRHRPRPTTTAPPGATTTVPGAHHHHQSLGSLAGLPGRLAVIGLDGIAPHRQTRRHRPEGPRRSAVRAPRSGAHLVDRRDTASSGLRSPRLRSCAHRQRRRRRRARRPLSPQASVFLWNRPGTELVALRALSPTHSSSMARPHHPRHLAAHGAPAPRLVVARRHAAARPRRGGHQYRRLSHHRAAGGRPPRCSSLPRSARRNGSTTDRARRRPRRLVAVPVTRRHRHRRAPRPAELHRQYPLPTEPGRHAGRLPGLPSRAAGAAATWFAYTTAPPPRAPPATMPPCRASNRLAVLDIAPHVTTIRPTPSRRSCGAPTARAGVPHRRGHRDLSMALLEPPRTPSRRGVLPASILRGCPSASFDQYAQSVRWWSPDSSAFVYAGRAGAATGVWVQQMHARSWHPCSWAKGTAPYGPRAIVPGSPALRQSATRPSRPRGSMTTMSALPTPRRPGALVAAAPPCSGSRNRHLGCRSCSPSVWRSGIRPQRRSRALPLAHDHRNSLPRLRVGACGRVR